MVNVTKENFIEQSNDLLLHLPTAAFVAIDEEMTGISVTKGRIAQDVTPAQRYPDLKRAPERYSIIQLGIALYHRTDGTGSNSSVVENGSHHTDNTSGANGGLTNEKAPAAAVTGGGRGRGYASAAVPKSGASSSGYTVRRYNFYMFPAPSNGRDDSDEREVVLNPASVNFLHQHNMSFDLWSRQGVPYTTTAKATATLESYVAKEKEIIQKNSGQGSSIQPPTVQETIRRRVELRRNEDIDFHARAMAGLREWLDSPMVAEPLAAAGDGIGEVNAEAAAMVAGSDDEVEGGEEEDGAVDTASGASYLLPPCNSFLRRALFESIEKDYPTLEVESAPNQQIKVWRLNEEEKAARHRRLRRENWEDLIGAKLGMWRVFEGLRRACSGLDINRSGVLFAKSYETIDWANVNDDDVPEEEEQTRGNIPLIVHNGFMDLCFLFTHFHASKLPDSYQDCKDLISDHFPIVYDTKVLATECPCWENNDAIGAHNSHSSNLSNLFQIVVASPAPSLASSDAVLPLLDDIHVVASVGRSTNGMPEDQEHEAAYDAYMTGAIFLGMCRRIQRVSASALDFCNVISDLDSTAARRLYGRNKVYQMSMYTMDLEETRDDRDPMSRGMLPEYTYRVANIDKAVTTRDIVRCLAGTTDASGRPVNFEIVWIDDTTFLVAASSRHAISTDSAGDDAASSGADNDTAEYDMLKEHGALLMSALRTRFSHDESITVLEEYLASIARGSDESNLAQGRKRTWTDWMLSAFGLARVDKSTEPMERLANKRQRLS